MSKAADVLSFARQIASEGDILRRSGSAEEKDGPRGRLIQLLQDHDRVIDLARWVVEKGERT